MRLTHFKRPNSISTIQTIDSIARQCGGPSRSVPGLCDALSEAGALVSIVTMTHSGEIQLRPKFQDINVVNVNRPNGLKWLFASSFRRALKMTIHKTGSKIVHDHGIWLPSNHATASVCFDMNIRRVVSPRGMLEPWSMKHKNFKKKPAWILYQRKDLESAAAFHATSVTEAESIRQQNFQQPIAVIPNGISMPLNKKSASFSNSSKKRQAIFISRFNPKKGLPILVKAWEIVKPVNWRLMIVGPDESGYRTNIQALIINKGLEDCIELVDEVDDEKKWKMLIESQLFILPSFSENFGIAIAEALAAGVPVITTRTTPWSELEQRSCGWWIDTGVKPLVEALREATEMDRNALQTIGNRGAGLISKKYSWAAIGKEMLQFYSWLLGAGDKPSCLFK